MQNEPPTTLDPSGEKPSATMSQPSLASLEAGRSALGSEIPIPIQLNRHGKPKGQPGRPIKSGKWAKRKIPVSSVGNAATPLLVEDTPGAAVDDFQMLEPAPAVGFDKAAAEPYAASIVNLYEELNQELAFFRVHRRTKNKEFAGLVSDKCKLTVTSRELLKTGVLDCAEKYHVDLAKSPEAALIGGLLLSQLSTQRAIRSAIDEYLKMRPAE